jgi:hypothetical protein
MSAKRVEGKTVWFCTRQKGGCFGIVQSPDVTDERGCPIRHAFETDEDLEMHETYACSFVSKSETRKIRHPQQQMLSMTPKLDKKRKPILNQDGEQIMEGGYPLRNEKGHTVWHYVVTGEKERYVATQPRFTISRD